ncbi:MAG TPA: hypothetical protein VHV82_21525, partial [Sporichthyaceae bacterium]|nr:hypothetical protein [Sporichthyaceae bacterium]
MTMAKTYETTLRLLSRQVPRAVARADFASPSNLFPWGGPMNGQRGRQNIVRRLQSQLNFVAVVETGSFRGTTTEFLTYVTGAPVFTVESEPRYFHYARERLANLPEVNVELGDSRTYLRTLATRSGLPSGPTFFYLDAHWHDDLPLPEELAIVARHWPDATVMIDDFQVPDDPGYGYDHYSGGSLNRALIPGELLATTWNLAYPAIPAKDETG